MASRILPEEKIIQRIILLREEKVMLDIHLAELYSVETRILKQAVKRNIHRFPPDFMFELTDQEIDIMVSHFVIPSRKHLGGARPYAFTETGVAMLSSVLRSERAVEVNIAIMRTFVILRKQLQNHEQFRMDIDKIRQQLHQQGKNIELIFAYLDELVEKPGNSGSQPIGFRKNQ